MPNNDEPKRTPGQAEGGVPGKETRRDTSREPGRTPGSAEGDRKTIEEDLRNKKLG